MHRLAITLTFFGALILIWSLADYAEARRIGGGRSFGSKPQYQQSAPRRTPPQQDRSQTTPGQDQTGRKSGFMGGAGGMLGGMLMGGLIGSMLFGGGHGTGGIGLLEILVIGGGIYLLMRFVRARRSAAYQTASTGGDAYGSLAGGGFGRPEVSAAAAAPVLPPGFDVEEFLKGARAAYLRLQTAWDKRDLDDIRDFVKDEVWEEMRREAQDDPQPGRTEIVRLDAEVQSVEHTGAETVASVLFRVLMREDPQQAMAEEVQEIWHFSRDEAQPGSFWLLEGIQQVQ